MSIEQSTLPTNKFTLSPMTLTDSQEQLMSAIIGNIQNNVGLVESLNTESQETLNNLITTVNDMQSTNEVDVQQLQADIAKIMDVETEAGNDSFLGAFSKIFTAINERDETTAFELVIDESPNGIVNVDLMPFEFHDVSAFEVFSQVLTTPDGHEVNVSFKKVDTANGILTLRDATRLSDASNAESFYDASVKGTVTVALIIGRTATALTATVTNASTGRVETIA